jgi:hypothetical protein
MAEGGSAAALSPAWAITTLLVLVDVMLVYVAGIRTESCGRCLWDLKAEGAPWP